MKKLLAIILILTFALTSISAMAEYENIDCTETYTAGVIPANVKLEIRDEAGNVTQEAESYDNGTVYTRKVPTAYYSAGDTLFVATKNSMYGVKKDSYAMVYKVALPPLEPNQQYDQLWFNWTSSTSYPTADTLIKYPGEDWDFLSLSRNSDCVKAVIDDSDIAYEGSKIMVDSANGAYKRMRADVTSYANECHRLGQTYMYIGLTNASTKKVFGTQGYGENKEDTAAISFVTGPFSGLLTSKSILAWTDVSSLSSTGSGYTNPLDKLSTIRYDSAHALYKLPLPVLSETQTIVDYKLYIAIHGNNMGNGYGYNVYKVNDGADYFANQWSYFDHPFKDGFVEDHAMYNNRSTMSNSAADDVYEFSCANLTSYAKELIAKDIIPSDMYVGVATNVGSTITLKGYGQAEKYRPYVEYTIYDSNGVTQGYEVSELKIVPSESDRLQTADIDTLTAGTKYRAVMKTFNVEEFSKDVNMYVAIYSENNELESLIVLPCSVDALSTDAFVWSGEFIPETAGQKVKAFVWDASNDKPMIKSQTANVVAAE